MADVTLGQISPSDSTSAAGRVSEPPADGTAAGTDPAKRLKNLNKKLRQIEQLIKSGGVLSAEQQAKVDGRDAVVAEIAQLEASV